MAHDVVILRQLIATLLPASVSVGVAQRESKLVDSLSELGFSATLVRRRLARGMHGEDENTQNNIDNNNININNDDNDNANERSTPEVEFETQLWSLAATQASDASLRVLAALLSTLTSALVACVVQARLANAAERRRRRTAGANAVDDDGDVTPEEVLRACDEDEPLASVFRFVATPTALPRRKHDSTLTTMRRRATASARLDSTLNLIADENDDVDDADESLLDDSTLLDRIVDTSPNATTATPSMSSSSRRNVSPTSATRRRRAAAVQKLQDDVVVAQRIDERLIDWR